MAVIFSDGLEPYGQDRAATGPLRPQESPDRAWLARIDDDIRFLGDGIDVNCSRLPGGKWALEVNSVLMIFDKRPEFVIPRRGA